MSDKIAIKYPQYAYELQKYDGKGWGYHDALNDISLLLNATRHSRLIIRYFGYNWRIVRTSDNVVIAQKYVKVQS